MFKTSVLAALLVLTGCSSPPAPKGPDSRVADCVSAGTIPVGSPLISDRMISLADEFAQSYCEPGQMEECAERFVMYFMLAGKKKYGITPKETVAELQKNGDKYESLQDIERWMIQEHNRRLNATCANTK